MTKSVLKINFTNNLEIFSCNTLLFVPFFVFFGVTLSSSLVTSSSVYSAAKPFSPAAIVSLPEKNFFPRFELTRTLTIFAEHGIMAQIPWLLSQSKP